MKKISIIVLVLFVISLVIGLDCRRTYYHIDIGEKEEIGKHHLTVNYFSEDEFKGEEEGETSMWLQQHVDEETGEVYYELEEIANEKSEQLIFTEKEMEQNPTLKYTNMEREEGIRAVLDDAEYVVLARGTGKAKALGQTLQQEMHVEKVLKGDDKWQGKDIKAVSEQRIFMMAKKDAAESNGLRLYVNLMEEGEEYLVFLNPVKLKGKKYENVAYLADYKDVPYFNLADKENKIAKLEKDELGLDCTYYSDMEDNEFFVSDEAALNKLLEIKKEYLKKYAEELPH